MLDDLSDLIPDQFRSLSLAFLVLVVLQLAGYILYYALASFLILLYFITIVLYYLTYLVVVVLFFVVSKYIFNLESKDRYQLIQMIRNNFVYLYKKYVNKVEDVADNRMSFVTRKSRNRPEDLWDETGDSRSLCVVCYVNKRKVILMPCRHLCLCVECKRWLLQISYDNVCPLCRAPVRDSIEVYM